jgi:N-acetylglucosaminyldiphosphoundecaprenol N-acetyl-beta-D-mannosaminyltransferase
MNHQPEAHGPCASYPRMNILGVGVHAIRMADALDCLACWIENRVKAQAVVCPVYTVMLGREDPELGRIIAAAGLVTPDGMPLVFVGRLMGYRNIERVYGPDLMQAFCERASRMGYRSFLYGGAPGVADQLAASLTGRYPGLRIVGTYSPPFRDLTPDETVEVRGLINAAEPDVVWVGLGTPKQDKWIADNQEQINAPVMIGVGAAFDFLGNRVRQAPRWIQRSGMEWLFRLAMEPRRLWRRYLIYNPLFVAGILMQLLGLRRYDLGDTQRPEPAGSGSRGGRRG